VVVQVLDVFIADHASVTDQDDFTDFVLSGELIDDLAGLRHLNGPKTWRTALGVGQFLILKKM
jgi:hypothetical protein